MVLNPQLLAKISECIIVKLFSIVKDEDPGDSEAANDTFPDEVSNIFLCNNGQWFCLNPFGEVVDPKNKELELLYGNEEGSYYVQSPLGERPRGTHWRTFLRRLSHDIAKALTYVTCLYIGLGILLHSRLVVSSSFQLVNQ